jgi:hypothetical protein
MEGARRLVAIPGTRHAGTLVEIHLLDAIFSLWIILRDNPVTNNPTLYLHLSLFVSHFIDRNGYNDTALEWNMLCRILTAGTPCLSLFFVTYQGANQRSYLCLMLKLVRTEPFG